MVSLWKEILSILYILLLDFRRKILFTWGKGHIWLKVVEMPYLLDFHCNKIDILVSWWTFSDCCWWSQTIWVCKHWNVLILTSLFLLHWNEEFLRQSSISARVI